MKIDRRRPHHWLLLSLQGLTALAAALLRPLTPKAKKPLVLLYGHQFSGNLKALYREWERSFRDALDLCFICLDPGYSNRLRAEGIRARASTGPGAVLHLARCRAIITDHGLHAMSLLTRASDIRFIDVWHGIPFKGFIADDFRLQHRYDRVWLPSPLLVELYRDRFGFRPDQLLCLGYARTDILFNAWHTAPEQPAKLALPPGMRVLYAPTWQQDDAGRELFPFGESPHAFLDAIVAACRAHGATLLVRSHLNSALAAVDVDGVVFCPQRDFPDTEELLLQCDILVCDWSSIAFDFLALGRPMLFLDVPPPFRHGFSLGADFRAGAVVDSMPALLAALERYLSSPQQFDADFGALQQRILDQAYAPQTRGRAAQLQLSSLAACLRENQ